MAFIETVSAQHTNGEVRTMYARQQDHYGYIPNYAKVFSHRPEVMSLWSDLLAGIRRNIEPRKFELATLGAALALRNSACSIAHGKKLASFYPEQDVMAIAQGLDTQHLSDADRTIVSFAKKVAADAATITAADVEQLREHGFEDAEIFDIAAAASARCFFAKLLDSLGVQPDNAVKRLPEKFLEALSIGRPVSDQPDEIMPHA